MWDLPDGTEVLEFLGGISEPMGIPDPLSHPRSVGSFRCGQPLPVGRAMSLLAMQVRHGRGHMGNVNVGEAEAKLSTDAEESLVTFASHVAVSTDGVAVLRRSARRLIVSSDD